MSIIMNVIFIKNTGSLPYQHFTSTEVMTLTILSLYDSVICFQSNREFSNR